MEPKSATHILKEAILLERRGKAFYSMAAAHSSSEAAKKIFAMMADEEDGHIKYLSEQFVHYEKTQQFKDNVPVTESPNEEIAMQVLCAEIVKQVTAASYEAAAITAAIDFETRAVKIYSERAESATDANEKELYTMLAKWESSHHFWLHKMNEELKESIWFDNQFWPF